MPDLSVTTPAVSPVSREPARADDPLWHAAQQLERSFLSEMLAAAGFGEAREAFGGGAGEEQFSSFLRDAHAEAMVARGGLGLAESIYRAMAERSDDL